MHNALRLFKTTREYLTPTLKDSAFLSRGMLTPEEFVIAGDHLVNACPTWSWSSGETSKIRPYLPPDKQFLVTRGGIIRNFHLSLNKYRILVPSYRRVTELNADEVQEQAVESGLTGENKQDWCAPEVVVSNDTIREVRLEATQTIDRNVAEENNDLSSQEPDGVNNKTDGTFATFIHENHFTQSPKISNDVDNIPGSTVIDPNQTDSQETRLPSTIIAKQIEQITLNDNGNESWIDPSLALDDATIISNSVYLKAEAPDEDESATLLSRRYDISITYDNYYRTPRVWLFGYDENGIPLKPELIFQDIMTDYANRTVTLDPHPHLSRPHASIHPCQHGAAMKRILDELVSGGASPSVNQYMFVFLKFIQSVVPTIEYDYTMDVRVSAQKG